MIGKGLIGEGDAITGFDVTDQLIHTYKLSSPGAIDIVIHARSEDMLPDIERSILFTINRLRTGHVDSDALSRARKALKLEWHRIRSARRSLAYELGTFQVMDSWKTLQPYMEARTNVSVKEIQRVAATYFVPSNLTIATSRRNPITGTDPRLEK